MNPLGSSCEGRTDFVGDRNLTISMSSQARRGAHGRNRIVLGSALPTDRHNRRAPRLGIPSGNLWVRRMARLAAVLPLLGLESVVAA